MTTAQKIIKYLAIALAFTIIFSILGSLVNLGIFLTDSKTPAGESPSQWTFTKPVTKLDMDLGGTQLLVQPGEVFSIGSDSSQVTCTQKGNKVKVQEKIRPFGGSHQPGTLTVILPADLLFDEVEIDAGVGSVEINGLQTKRLALDLGAGKVQLSNLNVTEKADFDGGAGKITVQNSTLTDLDMDLGVGDLVLSGSLPGQSEIDCGVGKVELSLMGEGYRLRLDKGVGEASINGTSMESGTFYGTGANNLEISGGIGSIQIDLAYNES